MGAVSLWSGQLLSASGQPRVPRSTVRRPCGSLPGSTGLISLAPLGWAQLPQLSGNGGCRHSSAVQLSWRAAALQLFAAAAAAHLFSPQLLASAGSLSAHLLPFRWAPGSPASLSLTFSADPPPSLCRHLWFLEENKRKINMAPLERAAHACLPSVARHPFRGAKRERPSCTRHRACESKSSKATTH